MEKSVFTMFGNNIFTSVVLLYMYAYLPMDVILKVFWMKFHNYRILVIKISDNNLMIVIFTLKSILKKCNDCIINDLHCIINIIIYNDCNINVLTLYHQYNYIQ